MDGEKLERKKRDFWENEKETQGENLEVQGVTKNIREMKDEWNWIST